LQERRFIVEQMMDVLKQAQVVVPLAEVIQKAEISEPRYYRWESKYAGLEVDQADRWHSCKRKTRGRSNW
jgi:putative transposase